MTWLGNILSRSSDKVSSEPAQKDDVSWVTEPILTYRSSMVCSPNWPLDSLKNEDQLHKVNQFREKVPSLLIDATTNPEQRKKEEEWCDDACLIRYLKATKWDLDASITRLTNSLKWRREYKPDEMNPEDLKAHAQYGKVYWNGFDNFGHAIIHMVLKNPSSKDHAAGLHYSVYLMEQTFRFMPKGVEKICFIMDYREMISDTPINISKQWISILSDHYPERLAHAFLVNPSWYIWVFFKLVGYLIDPVTKAKIHFVNTEKLLSEEEINHSSKDKPEGYGSWTDLRLYVDNYQLESRVGGSFNFKFDKDIYWNHFSEKLKN